VDFKFPDRRVPLDTIGLHPAQFQVFTAHRSRRSSRWYRMKSNASSTVLTQRRPPLPRLDGDGGRPNGAARTARRDPAYAHATESGVVRQHHVSPKPAEPPGPSIALRQSAIGFILGVLSTWAVAGVVLTTGGGLRGEAPDVRPLTATSTDNTDGAAPTQIERRLSDQTTSAVVKTGTGSGTVMSSPFGILCGNACLVTIVTEIASLVAHAGSGAARSARDHRVAFPLLWLHRLAEGKKVTSAA
jgi:hypothetical protein